jgi:formylmethanofuran dehydrogenase subunit E
MAEEEETPQERRERWMEREARKADERRRPKIAKCARCGKDVEEGEFIEFEGRILCADCYADALEKDMDISAADGTGAG